MIRDTNNNGTVEYDEILGSSYNAGSTPDEINQDLTPGSYYLQVTQYFGDTDYDLLINPAPIATQLDLAGNSLGAAYDVGSLGASPTFTDSIGSTDLDDYYRFELTETSTVTSLMYGLNANANLELIQDSNSNGSVDLGEVVATSERYGVVPEELTTILGTGTYYARVSSDGLITTNYTLNLSAAPIPDLAGDVSVQGVLENLRKMPDAVRVTG
ncbi:MAG: hypothetical protein HC825_00625 [Oscillatoriales cyanobacterium RM1_1_9]|nr:hypothetical protein [Oscillatoriales cyanobacterium RM2_1_1]NJO70611.1 hypothetical protein [Oscillatoriales cyanobacterium RM1_1_9]